jgi:heat shock protein HslJ
MLVGHERRQARRETTLFRSLSSRRAWIIGLCAPVLGVAVIGLMPFAAPAPIPQASPTSPAPASITQSPWLWQRTERGDGSTLVAPDPSKYTVSFGPDGRFAVQADCNRARGTYAISGSWLTFEPAPITLIACPPTSRGSQDMVFYRDLHDTATYVFEGEQLVLYLKVDGGHMVFGPRPPSH